MKKIILSTVLALLLMLSAAPVYAGVPALPHAFYGSVDINGDPALDGTKISATTSQGSVVAIQNPVTTEEGSYGLGSPPLLVQGDIPPGAIITFHVTNANGTAIGGTYPFEAGGGPDRRDLLVTIAPSKEEPVGGGGRGAEPPTVETNLFGEEWSFRISDEGEILTTITATSEDGNLAIRVPAGIIALDKYGNPLDSLEAAVDESPPDPPEDARIIGLAYDFGPDGATFDPAITLTWNYDPEALPEGVVEEDLVLACYVAGEWVEVDCVVDTENNTITASVEHFTTFAIIDWVKPAAFTLSSLVISPTEVALGEKVSISISVANTGGIEGSYTTVLKINGVKEAEKSVTIAAGRKESVAFSVTRAEAGNYSVDLDGVSGSFTVLAPTPPPAPAPPPPAPPVTPPPPPAPPELPEPAVNWPLIGGIITAVILVGLLIFLLVRRRAY